MQRNRGPWRRLLAALPLALALPAGAGAADTETLFVYPPDGWRLGFQTEIGPVRFFEYLPDAETAADWTEMITVQIMKNAEGLGPGDLTRAIRARFTAECAHVAVRGPDRFNMNGLLAARLYVECTDPTHERRPGGAPYRKHEVAAYQVIQGKRDLYVIERAWHGGRRDAPGAPYGRTDVWGWDAFWHGIEVCDTGVRDRPCFGLGLLSRDKAEIFVYQVDPQLPYGCTWFRTVTLLPDMTKPARPTMVVPYKLDRGPFGDAKAEHALIERLLEAYRENRPTAVILTMAERAVAGILPADLGKAERDARTIAGMLVDAGVAPARLYEGINPDCPGG
ncbi:MAG: hypothetical protein VW405_20000 [Rhodospirillaceae bacterium]